MKKVLAFIIVVVLVLTATVTLVACDVTGKGTVITFYHTMGSNLSDVLDIHIKNFQKIYPNITIKWTKVGGYDDVRDQTSKDIQVGKGPSLAYCYPDHVALYNKAKAVVTLDDYINSTETVPAGKFGNTEEQPIGLTAEQIADFIPGYYEEGKVYGDGKMYTLPLSKSTEVLYYNKTFFTKNNLKVPDHWFAANDNDDTSMEYVCKKIKEIDPGSTPLGYDSEANWFITMCEQYGSDYTSATGDHFLFNNETNRTFAKKFNEWYNKGYVTTQTIYGTYTSGLFTETAADKGKSYMSIGSSAGATHQRPTKKDNAYPFDVGITSIPQLDANNPKVISQGPSLVMLKRGTADQQLATWLFMKFLTTNVQFQAAFSLASGYVPVLKSVGDNPVYADALASADGGDFIAMLSAKVCLEQADAYYVSPAFLGSSDARDEVGDLLVKCIKEQKTGAALDTFIAQAFAQAVENCNYKQGK